MAQVRKTRTCDSEDNAVCMGVRERLCVCVRACVWHQHMVVMPQSKAEDRCTIVWTEENGKGPLNGISLHRTLKCCLVA